MKKKSPKDRLSFPSFRTKVSKLEKIILSYIPENEEQVRKTIRHELDIEGVYK